MKRCKITITGLGYVGMSLAVLLGRTNDICALDKDVKKVNQVNAGDFQINDECAAEYLKKYVVNIRATTDPKEAYADADYIIITVPTDYDRRKN